MIVFFKLEGNLKTRSPFLLEDLYMPQFEQDRDVAPTSLVTPVVA